MFYLWAKHSVSFNCSSLAVFSSLLLILVTVFCIPSGFSHILMWCCKLELVLQHRAVWSSHIPGSAPVCTPQCGVNILCTRWLMPRFWSAIRSYSAPADLLPSGWPPSVLDCCVQDLFIKSSFSPDPAILEITLYSHKFTLHSHKFLALSTDSLYRDANVCLFVCFMLICSDTHRNSDAPDPLEIRLVICTWGGGGIPALGSMQCFFGLCTQPSACQGGAVGSCI